MLIKLNHENACERLEMLFTHYCLKVANIELEYCEVLYDSDCYDEDDEENLGEDVLNIFYKIKDDNCDFTKLRKERNSDDEHHIILYRKLSQHDFNKDTLNTFFIMTGYSPCDKLDTKDFIDFCSKATRNK